MGWNPQHDNNWRNYRFKPASKIIVRSIAGETLLVPIRGKLADMERIFALEGAGTLIWSGIADGNTAEEIVTRIAETYEIDLKTAETDFHDFIMQLFDTGLIEFV